MQRNTKRCLIRQLRMEDAEDLYTVLSDTRVMAYIEDAFDMEKTKDFIQNAGLCRPPLVWAVQWRDTGRVIGHAIFHPFHKSEYEIGWILHRNYWGMGIAGELTRALIDWAEELDADRLILECSPLQAASRKIALRHGFIYAGNVDGLDLYKRELREKRD